MKKNAQNKREFTIKWLEKAVEDLEALREYIGNDNPVACNMVTKRIIRVVNLLEKQPEIGRSGRISNVRELVISGLPYIIPYRIKRNVNIVEILRIFHGAMQWPKDI